MAEDKTTEAKWPTPEVHHDIPRWDAGFQAGMDLGVELFLSAENPHESKIEMEAQTALRMATGHCAMCDSTEAIEIQPRHSSRQTIRLCDEHLQRASEPMRSFPGDPPPEVRDYDDPLWSAGFHAGLLQSIPFLFDGREGPRMPNDQRERHANRIAHLKGDTCSLCPGHATLWIGGCSLRFCPECRDYLAEYRKQAAYKAVPEIDRWRESAARKAAQR